MECHPKLNCLHDRASRSRGQEEMIRGNGCRTLNFPMAISPP